MTRSHTTPSPMIVFGTAFLLAATWFGAPLSAIAQEASIDETTVAQVRVGFEGIYKVGYWTPVTVTLRGGVESNTGAVELLVPDGDGVDTVVTTLAAAPVQTRPGVVTEPVMMYAKFGRTDSGLRVRYVVDGKAQVEQEFPASVQQSEQFVPHARPSTDELILTVGPSVGVDKAVRQRNNSQNRSTVHVVPLSDVSALPTRWYGYEGVNMLVLSTSQPELYRSLLAGGARIEALKEWVRLGGRLVMFVGAEADEILDDGSPLADLAPGVFAGPDRMAPLRQTRALEVYSGTSNQIDTGDGNFRIDVPLLSDITGNIEAYDGNRPTDLPLVIRSAYGFGEVVFVALDLDRPPFAQWKGRSDFLRKVLRRETLRLDDENDQVGQVTVFGYSDLVGQLRHALEKFQDVSPAPFGLVAALVCLYILLIGPGDYFLVKKFLKRMELTWITFPTIVVAVSVGAYYLAYWMKGDELRVNQVELVDVDIQSDLVRGTTWTQIFSPNPDAYNLSLAPQLPDGRSPENPRVLLSWLGLPGPALGGMLSSNPPLFSRPYSFSDSLDALQDVPIQVWSTKSVTARWTASDATNLSGNLREEIDEMLSGEVVNRLGVDLVECRLFYDRWVYTFTSLKDGGRQALGNALAPKTIKTWMENHDCSRSWQDVPDILNYMMFGKAAHSVPGALLANHYQSFTDLSDHLTVGRAVLLARVAQDDAATHGSQLLRDGQPLSGPQDQRWVFYRFVFSVQRDH